jgi:hypothetical protein
LNTARLAAASVAAVALMSTSPTARAAGTPFQGLLRSRDLTSFGFPRLDMRPARTTSFEPEAWAFEAVLGYQNTWALSQNVERFLKSVEPEGRRDLSTYAAQIEALPGEKYLVDLEAANLDLVFHHRISARWTGFLIAGAVSYQGGFFDSGIEGFHRIFGLGQSGRLAATRNQVNELYALKSAPSARFNASAVGGLTDPVIGFRHTGASPMRQWAYALEGAVKVPIAGTRAMLSTGRFDVGVQGSLQRFWNRDALYLDLSAVYYAGAAGLVPQDAQVVPTVVVGYERIVGTQTSLVLQGYISRSTFSRRQTDLDELLGRKYQLSFGVRHRMDDLQLSCGFTENLQNVNNTPDIGFQFGIAYEPPRRASLRGSR